MEKRLTRIIAIGFISLFVGVLATSCAAKKKCNPPCPTWQKKRPHR